MRTLWLYEEARPRVAAGDELDAIHAHAVGAGNLRDSGRYIAELQRLAAGRSVQSDAEARAEFGKMIGAGTPLDAADARARADGTMRKRSGPSLAEIKAARGETTPTRAPRARRAPRQRGAVTHG